MLRHLQDWRATHEASGLIEVICCPDGSEWSIWDIELLLDRGLPLIPHRQAEAIRLYLIEGLKEQDTAIRMGLSPTNPVGMYATNGIKALCALIDAGQIYPSRSTGVA